MRAWDNANDGQRISQGIRTWKLKAITRDLFGSPVIATAVPNMTAVLDAGPASREDPVQRGRGPTHSGLLIVSSRCFLEIRDER